MDNVSRGTLSFELADSRSRERPDLCATSVVFPPLRYFLPAARLCRTRDRGGWPVRAHLSSIPTNQALRKTLAQTSLRRQIVSASNAPSASLSLLGFFFFFVLFFQFACLPPARLLSVGTRFIVIFGHRLSAALSFTLANCK